VGIVYNSETEINVYGTVRDRKTMVELETKNLIVSGDEVQWKDKYGRCRHVATQNKSKLRLMKINTV